MVLAVVGVLVLAVTAVAYGRWSENACTPWSGGCIRVLFLGNSYTYVNDLPGMFRRLARSGGRAVETGMVAAGGETLAQHAASSESLDAIQRVHWRFIVIQEQSQIPSLPALRDSEMAPAVRSLVARIRQIGATPVLLETWAHRDGWPENGLDYASMQASIDSSYMSLGAETGADVARSGEAWQSLVGGSDPLLATSVAQTLWQADGSHPTSAGTYLVACVLYARLFGASPIGLADDEGLRPELARRIQTAVAAFTS
jgi:hypothetical protein